MYASTADGPLEQGDVVRGVPFPYVKPGKARLVTEEGGLVEWDLCAAPPPTGSAALAPVHCAHGLVVSQDCDIVQAKTPFVLVARIYPIQERARGYEEAEQKGPDASAGWLRQNLLNLGRYVPLFYLQQSAEQGLPVSVADLREIHPVPRADALVLAAKGILRLTPHAKQFLQARLAHFFGRFAVREEEFLTPEQRATLVAE
ncbi:MAG: hypothetical protein FJX75_08840 [Armatimonadetes bacterium]|nr:hypothetical protein [Armatimonadota bacterium]